MKLNDGFKYAAIGIACLTALLLWRDSSLEERRKQSAIEYKERQKAEEKEEIAEQKRRQELAEEKTPQINSISEKVDACMAAVPLENTKMVIKEDDIFVDYIKFLSAKNQDSVKRANGDRDYLLAKLNPANTLILRGINKENKAFNFAEYINLRAFSQNRRNSASLNYMVWNTSRSYASRSNSPTKSLLERLDDLKYLVIVQITEQMNPKVESNNGFQSGYIVSKVTFFELSTGKKLEEKTVVSSNSESISVMNGLGNSMLRADLLSHFNKEVLGFILGKKSNRQ